MRIVVASPGDVRAEREALPAVLEELNRGLAATHGVRLEVSRWEADAYPGFHDRGPQGLLDPILKIEECDLLICIFWKRFGTPTDDAQGGTEHEFRLAYEARRQRGRPQIMLYFREADEPASEEEKRQLCLVREFQKSLPREGLWWAYENPSRFESLVRNHLSNFIRDQFPIPAVGISERSSDELTKAFLAQLAARVGKIYLLDEAEPRELEKVFVELDVVEEYRRPSAGTEYLGLMDAEMRRRRDLFASSDEVSEEGSEDEESDGELIKRQVKPDELLRERTQAVITGAPGCGKTTLLRYLAWKTLKEGQRLPVFLELKTVTEEVFKLAQNNLAELLFDRALVGALYLTPAERERARASFFARLAAGEVMICLDGLDEVTGTDFFPALCNSVREFVRSAYRDNALVISTRPYALQTRFDELKEMEIAPLSRRQVEEFLKHYYGHDQATKELLRALRQRGQLRELARVPFLLSVIAQLHRTQHELVGNRLKLYEQIVLHLAVRLDNEKSLPRSRFHLTDPEGSLKLDFLRHLAFQRLLGDDAAAGGEEQGAARLTFTSEVLLEQARQFLEKEQRPEIDPRLLAADAKATPLLREVAADVYAFAHLTIQEYLAAVALSRHRECEKIFCRAYFDPALVGSEVLPMTLGLARTPENLYAALERLPESLTFTNLRLRARGLAYAPKLDEQLSASLADHLGKFIAELNPEEVPYADAVLRSFYEARNPKYILNELAGLIKTGTFQERRWLVASLGRIGGRQAVPALIAALKDEAIAESAIDALSDVGDKGTVPALLAASKESRSSSVRRSIVTALGKIGGESVIPALSEAIKDNPGYYGRREAARALAGIAGERAVSGLIETLKSQEDKTGREGAIEALGEIGGENAVSGLLEALEDEDQDVRESAAKALGETGDGEAVPALIEALKDEDGDVRWRAAGALGDIGDARAVPRLVKALKDKESITRQNAAEALGKIKDERAVPALIEALKDRDWGVRKDAAEALGAIGDKRAVPALLKTLKDVKDDVRGKAVEALGDLREESAVSVLLHIVCDEDETTYMRSRGVYALGVIGGERAVGELVKVLRSNYSRVRRNAAYTLGRLGDRRAVPALIEAMEDEDSGIQLAAIEALRVMGQGSSVPGLIKALGSHSPRVCGKAAEALGKIGDARAVPALLKAAGGRPAGLMPWGVLNEEDDLARQKAAKALGEMDHKNLAQGLVTAFWHGEKAVRLRAAQVIGYYVCDERVLKKLSRLATFSFSGRARRAFREARDKFAQKLQYFKG